MDYNLDTPSTLITVFVIERLRKLRSAEDQLEIEIATLAGDDRRIVSIVNDIRSEKNIENIKTHLDDMDYSSMEIKGKVRSLILSKLTGVSIGEWVAIFGSAIISIITTIFYRNSGFLFDIYALILSSIIVFLVFMVISDEVELLQMRHATIHNVAC